MKLPHPSLVPSRAALRRREQGNILLISLSAMLILGLALVTFLTLAMNQNQMVVHAQTWNASMPIAEAGVEDALNHCAWNGGTWASSGWSRSGTTFIRSNTFSEGWYNVSIATNSLASNYVTITSTGYFPMSGVYLPRTVRVMALSMPVYRFGMFAKAGISFNGNGIVVDSYDSRDSTKSTKGLYDSSKAGDKADIGCYSGTSGGSYDIGNGNIWGHVHMGPGGTISCGPNGKVGDVAWQNGPVKSGVESGWLKTDLNVSVPDVTVPFSGGFALPAGAKIGGVTYDYIFTSGNYTINGNLSGKVLVSGNALIYVKGDISISTFRLLTNTSVAFYAGGSVDFPGTGNETQRAVNLEILGLKTCTSVDLDDGFMGAVNAPYADFTLKGARQIYGSFCFKSLTLKGGSDIHFDEAVADPGSSTTKRGYIITSWTEL